MPGNPFVLRLVAETPFGRLPRATATRPVRPAFRHSSRTSIPVPMLPVTQNLTVLGRQNAEAAQDGSHDNTEPAPS